jgi:hypothetical protein
MMKSTTGVQIQKVFEIIELRPLFGENLEKRKTEGFRSCTMIFTIFTNI